MKFSRPGFFFLFYLSVNFSNAQEWVSQSIDLAINAQFAEAESLLTTRMAMGDSSLKVFFYYASVLNSKMTHFENSADEKEFYAALQHVIQTGELALKKDNLSIKEKAQILFYTGSAYGYLAFYQGQSGEWFSAVKNGNNAREYLLRAIDEDSTQWDAYLGLGAYKYWLAAKIHWLPFVSDEREEGIIFIKKAIENNSVSRPMAMHQLIYVLLDFGEFEQAQNLADKLVEEYPRSPFMYWAHSHVYMKKKDLDKAIHSYHILLGLIEEDEKANPNHKITCLARLMDMYARKGNCTKVREISARIVKDKYYITTGNSETQRLLDEVKKRCE
jgi:tetratricopeptide (TPR) repeat protein